MKKFWFKKALMICCFVIVAVLAFGFLVMVLWNAILPKVIVGVQAITFLQALGILLLSKILFGGFGGKGSRHKAKWVAMKEKFSGMTPEEKEKFKAEWKNRCGGRWRMHQGTDSASTMAAE